MLGRLNGCPCADMWCLVLFVLRGMQIEQLVQKDINAFTVIHQPQEKLLFGQRNKGVCDVSNPKNRRLSILVQRQTIEVDVDIIGNEAY